MEERQLLLHNYFSSNIWICIRWSIMCKCFVKVVMLNPCQHCLLILSFDMCTCVSKCANACTYHEDVDEVAGGGVPHLQRQIVGRCDHRAVMAIPCYHSNLQLCHLVFQRRRVVLPKGKDVFDTRLWCSDQDCIRKTLHKRPNKSILFLKYWWKKWTIYHPCFSS